MKYREKALNAVRNRGQCHPAFGHFLQKREIANLAEFPVLQMLYKQGLIIPRHPNNIGTKPLLIGSADHVESQLRYIYWGNYGLVSREEIIQTGISEELATEMMRLKLN